MAKKKSHKYFILEVEYGFHLYYDSLKNHFPEFDSNSDTPKPIPQNKP